MRPNVRVYVNKDGLHCGLSSIALSFRYVIPGVRCKILPGSSVSSTRLDLRKITHWLGGKGDLVGKQVHLVFKGQRVFCVRTRHCLAQVNRIGDK
jgi:hypothetical protein